MFDGSNEMDYVEKCKISGKSPRKCLNGENLLKNMYSKNGWKNA